MSAELGNISDLFENNRQYSTLPLEFGHVRSRRGLDIQKNTPIPGIDTDEIPLIPQEYKYGRPNIPKINRTYPVPYGTTDIRSERLISAEPVLSGEIQLIDPETKPSDYVTLSDTERLFQESDESVELEDPKTQKHDDILNITDEDISKQLYDILMQSYLDNDGPYRDNLCDLECETSKAQHLYVELRQSKSYIVRSSDGWEESSVYNIIFTRWAPKKPTSVRVLFLHDIMDSRTSWMEIQSKLCGFVETVAPDMLGFGDSSVPKNYTWCYKNHANIMLDFAESVWGKNSYYVVGVGYGSQIGAFMASMSNKIIGNIMINPMGFPPNNSIPLPYLSLLDHKEDLTGMSSAIQSLYQQMFSSSDSHRSGRDAMISPMIKKILGNKFNKDRQMVLIEHIQFMQENNHCLRPKTVKNEKGIDIGNIRCPTMIISGGNNIIFEQGQVYLYPYMYFNCKVSIVNVEELGHLGHIEHPNQISQLILNYITVHSEKNSLNGVFLGFVGDYIGYEKTFSKLANNIQFS